ncbi:unnamed protein product [Rotaria sp. Silwood1]|nr:unnamed protein product [Rotaria sp. Silwood1]CAF3618118.1 unnamed protein product [Rotaria sp. Silwood1]
MMFLQKSLTTLQLDGNDIGDKGAYHIADGLKTNQTLRKLSLRYNEIGYKGAFRLADVLRNNTVFNIDCQSIDIE